MIEQAGPWARFLRRRFVETWVRPVSRVRVGPFPMLVLSISVTLSCGEDSSTLAPNLPPGSTYSPASYREAGRITAAGAKRSMEASVAGETEGAVKERILEKFHAEGSTIVAFDPIVAAGANAISLHYPGSDGILRAGDLLLVDIGATSDDICSDCTRTFPIGAVYGARQRELYQLVLDIHEQVVRTARPGLDSLVSLNRRARELLRESSLRARDPGGELQTMDRFFTHSIGHYVGKRVHGEETGWSALEPLETGQVLAIEPGIYIDDEGIGIRIEDTYLVTDSGLECLTCDCPKVVEAVEALRAAPDAGHSVLAGFDWVR